MRADVVDQLRALIEARARDEDTDSALHRIWKELQSRVDEPRWRDFDKFRADVDVLSIHGML